MLKIKILAHKIKWWLLKLEYKFGKLAEKLF